MIFSAMKELKKSLLEKLAIWDKYEKVIENQCNSTILLNLYSFLIQAALFSEQGISMLELQQNMNCSKYAIKKLMANIPTEMIVVKTKNKYKFYSISLDKLNDILLKEAISSIQKAE